MRNLLIALAVVAVLNALFDLIEHVERTERRLFILEAGIVGPRMAAQEDIENG